MNTYRRLGMALGFLALLAVPAASQNYDNSADQYIIIPECIWAPATGGGTWITEVQIIAPYAGTVVSANFYYGTSFRIVPNLWAPPATGNILTVRFSNILSTLQSRDPSFSYYKSVGALMLYTQDASHRIVAQARTVNGNYGKTFPGLRWVDSNTANLNRNMMILNLTQNGTYRTFVGFFNATAGDSPITVEFYIIDRAWSAEGAPIVKTFQPWEFWSFNPFAEAQLDPQIPHDNLFLFINPISSGQSGPGSRGLFCFGSSANNYTNDTCAHIAVQAWQ